jgi:hypothetical protein
MEVERWQQLKQFSKRFVKKGFTEACLYIKYRVEEVL